MPRPSQLTLTGERPRRTPVNLPPTDPRREHRRIAGTLTVCTAPLRRPDPGEGDKG